MAVGWWISREVGGNGKVQPFYWALVSTPNVRHNVVETTFVCAIMRTHLTIKQPPRLLPRTMLITNHNIGRFSRHGVTNAYYILKVVHSHCHVHGHLN